MQRIVSYTGIFIGIALVACPLGGANPPPAPRVVVVSDLTAVGQKEARVPDAAHPVYYVPLTPAVATPSADAQALSREEVFRRVLPALAARHYLPAGPGHPPELVLSFWWGTADPQLENFGLDDASEEESFNALAMNALVGADKKQELMNWHSRDLRAAMREERHYLIVMAFDYAAAVKKQKKVLWITRTSTPAAAVGIGAVMDSLVTTAGPAFGREARPTWVDSGKARNESVRIAPLEVQETVPEKK